MEQRTKKGWSKKIMEFEGIEGFGEDDRFENFRKDLKAPKEDIFGEAQ